MCGTNSPNILGRRFYELAIDGTPNEDGFALKGFVAADGQSLRFHVRAGRIMGEEPSGVEREGMELLGAKLYVVDSARDVFAIRIASVEETPFWAGHGSSVTPSYILEYSSEAGEKWLNLCDKYVDEDGLGLQGHASVVFEHDRISKHSITVEPDWDEKWFTIGCAGSALSKLHLLGYTNAATAYGFESTVEERQTALKSITADYCGAGRPFTVPGTALAWRDDRDSLKYPKPGTTMEARWTPDGASCLNEPRLRANPSPLGDQTFPNLEEAIYLACGKRELPPCEGYDEDDLAGHSLATGNPP